MAVTRLSQLPEGSGNLTNDDIFIFMDDPSGSGITKKISLSQISDNIVAKVVDFAPETLNTLNELAAALGDNADFFNDVAYSGDNISKFVNDIGYSVSGHTHTASNITNFNSSVSGLLPSKYPTVVQLGSVSGTINTNASLGDIFDLTLASSGTLANPSGSVDGQTLRWRISHNANSLVLNFGNQFKIPSSATSPLPLSSTSGNMDILGATYDSSRSKWDIIAFVPGY